MPEELQLKDISELNPYGYKTNANIDANLKILFSRLFEFQDLCGFDFVINSGLRDQAQQDALISAGKTNAVHSNHLAGAAADIADEDGSLKEWVKNNMEIMANIGLWMESFESTPNWLHVQILPPKSGKRVFIP